MFLRSLVIIERSHCPMPTHKQTWIKKNYVELFTLPDTDTGTDTNTDAIGLQTQFVGVSIGIRVSVGQCEHTIRISSVSYRYSDWDKTFCNSFTKFWSITSLRLTEKYFRSNPISRWYFSLLQFCQNCKIIISILPWHFVYKLSNGFMDFWLLVSLESRDEHLLNHSQLLYIVLC